THGVTEFRQQRRIPHAALHELHGLFGADPARRALAAAFILEEAHQVQRRRLDVVLVRQDDDRGRANEAAAFFQRPEVERNIIHRGRQDAPGRAARQIGLERVAFGHAAAELVDELAYRHSRRGELDPRVAYPSRDRKAPGALAAVAALAIPPVDTFFDDV